MSSVGQLVFYLAVGVGALAAVVRIAGLLRMAILGFRGHPARRPMWVNYAGLTFGLAVPIMVVGLVLWGRLDWWFVLLFAPFVAMRLVLFRFGSSISRRNQAPGNHT